MQQKCGKMRNLVLFGFLFVILVLPSSAVFAEPSEIWINTFGGSGDDEAHSVKVSSSGYAFVGITNSSGLGQNDVLLIKTDFYGSMEWNQTYGGFYNDLGYSLVTTPDDGYALAGSTSSFGAGSADFWLIKVDSFGTMEWNKTYGTQKYDSCRSLVATGDSGYALLGYSTNVTSDDNRQRFRLGDSDIWLIKVDSLGNMIWNKTYGGVGSDSVSTIIETADGGFVLGCSTSSFGAGSADFWLIKVDSFGTMEWNKTYGGLGIEYANSLVVADDGGYAMTGSTSTFGNGSADVWLVKVNSLGNLEWNRTYGTPRADYCDSIVISKEGGYTLACITQPPTFGDGEFWLIEVDSLGSLKLNQTYGTSAHHSHTSLLRTTEDNYILGGSTRDTWGLRDFWLVEIGESNTGSEISMLILPPILVIIFLFVFLIYRRASQSYSIK
jgi:predicted secreted protein